MKKLTCVLSAGIAGLAIVVAPAAAAATLPKLCLSTDVGTTCQPLGTVGFQHARPSATVLPDGFTP